MELKELCIGDECDYRNLCNYSKGKIGAMCPVYCFSSKKVVLKKDEKGYYRGSPLQQCPSCGQWSFIEDGKMCGNDIWGDMICGYCLFEFGEMGYPIKEVTRSHLKSREFNIRNDGRVAWSVETCSNNSKKGVI